VSAPSDDPTAPLDDKPLGREAVMAALIDATTELIVEQGVAISVREIAQRAGVNHGLVHTYFGSKDALLDATFRAINERAAAELDDTGFPPADLAFRRNGELAKATARALLDIDGDPFPTHPVLPSWRRALAATNPDADDHELDERVLVATTFALGWSMFAQHFGRVLELSPDDLDTIEQHVTAIIAGIGGVPHSGPPAPRWIAHAAGTDAD
jgi:AcrR family transcriptional regulator